MATSILFPGSTAGPALSADPTSYTFGVQISVSQNCVLNAVRFFSPTGAAVLPQTIGVYQVTGAGTGTLVHSESATWSGAAGSGWVRAKFSAPPALVTGTQYKVVVLQNTGANWYGTFSHYWSTVVPSSGSLVSGIITAPGNAGADGGQCTFNMGAALTYPTSSFNESNYYISPEVATEKFNTGTTAAIGGQVHSTPFTFTIPAGVAVGDVMVVAVDTFTFTPASLGVSTPTSGTGGANTWTPVAPGVTGGPSGGVQNYSTAWWRVATATDPGSTFTISWTGAIPSNDQFWWTACLVSYTGFYTASPLGAVPAPNAGAGTAVGACPSGSTQRANSWSVYLCPSTIGGSGSITGIPSGTIQRELLNPGSGVDCAIADSNGAVGDAASGIGGGSFTANNPSDWWSAWTLELATEASSGANVNGVPAAVAVAAPTGTENTTVNGVPAAVAATAPTGTESISLTGPVASVAVAAPIGQARGVVASKGGLFLAHFP